MTSRKVQIKPTRNTPHVKVHRGPMTSKSMVRRAELKYFDVLSLANNIGAGATIFSVDPVPVGAGQSQRVGDFISTKRIVLNYSLYCVNSDIVTSIRIILFRWRVSTAISAPVLNQILESPSSANVLSHFNFEFQDNYDVLWDHQFRASGIPTAPTDKSNFGQTGLVLPVGRFCDQEFSIGTTTGTNQLFFLAISDSSLTPFPIWNFSVRTYYEDTIRSHPQKMIK